MAANNIQGIAKTMLQARANLKVDATSKESVQDMQVSFMELMNQSSLSTSVSVSTDSNEKEIPTNSVDTVKTAYESKSSVQKNVSVKENASAKEIQSESENELAKYEEEIRKVLKEELGVTDEEIDAVMENLGFVYLDLRNMQNLAAVVQSLTGMDMGTLFLSESFQDVMHQVSTLTDALCEELGITREELTALCDEWKEMEVSIDSEESTENVAVLPEENASEEKLSVTDTATTELKAADKNSVAEETEVAFQQNQKAEEENPEDGIVEISESKEETTVEAATSEETTAEATTSEETTVEAATLEETTLEKTPLKETTLEETTVEAATLEETPLEEMAEESSLHQGEQEFSKNSGHAGNENTDAGISLAGVQTVRTENFTIPQEAVPYANQVNVTDIIEQVAKNLKVTITSEITSMEMQLNPENLGKIYLNVSERDGVVRAQIATQNEAVKNALETQLVELRQSLNQQSVKVDAIEVTVATHEFEQNLEGDAKQEEEMQKQMEEKQKQARRNLNLNDLEGVSGLMSEEEQLAAQIMKDNGNQVDLTA